MNEVLRQVMEYGDVDAAFEVELRELHDAGHGTPEYARVKGEFLLIGRSL